MAPLISDTVQWRQKSGSYRLLRVNKSGAISWKDVVVTQDVIFHRILVGNDETLQEKKSEMVSIWGFRVPALTLRLRWVCFHREGLFLPFLMCLNSYNFWTGHDNRPKFTWIDKEIPLDFKNSIKFEAILSRSQVMAH